VKRLRLILPLVALAAISAGSSDGIVHSVHFYGPGYNDGSLDWTLDFGRFPVPSNSSGWNDEMLRSGTLDETQFWAEQERLTTEFKILVTRTRSLEAQRKYPEAMVLLRKTERLYKVVQDNLYDYPLDVGTQAAYRSYVRDREEVLALPRRPGLDKYLRARWIIRHADPRIAEAESDLFALRSDPVLGPHAWYATIRDTDFNHYISLALKHPTSPRAPAALIMAARAMLRQSDTKISAAQVQRARRVLNRLMTKYPDSPYIGSAQGWLGRTHWLEGNVVKAKACYEQQIRDFPALAWEGYESLAVILEAHNKKARGLAMRIMQRSAAPDTWGQTMAGKGARHAFASLSLPEAREFQKLVRGDADLLAAYLRFRLEDTRLNQRQTRNLLAFANSALAGLPHAKADLLGRVAQMNYNIGRYRESLTFAERALKTPGKPYDRLAARYISSSALARLGQYGRAIQGYRMIVGSSIPMQIRDSALENIGLLSERHGDPADALMAYHRLKYRYDVAYLADAKLTPLQLARFIGRLPRSERGPYQYTLGLRYMRLGQYSAAKRAFLAVPTAQRKQYGFVTIPKYALSYQNEDTQAPRDPIGEVEKLQRLDVAIATAKGDEAKAKAIYAKGAHIYHRRNLLFYSPAMWQGSRAYVLGYNWSDALNTKDDERARARHHWEHECLAQSYKLFMQVVDKYPKSKVAPEAMYSAAMSAERLSHLNPWWRAHDSGLGKKSVALMEGLVKHHPDHPLVTRARKYAKVFREGYY